MRPQKPGDTGSCSGVNGSSHPWVHRNHRTPSRLSLSAFYLILSVVTKFFFYSEKLIVFGGGIGTGKGAGFYLPGVPRDRDIGYGCVFRLTRSMADDSGVAILPGKLDSVQGFTEGT